MSIPAAMVRLRMGPVPRKAPRKGPAATIGEAARTGMYQTTRTVVSDPAVFPYRLRISSDRVRPEVARMGLARAKRTIKVAAAGTPTIQIALTPSLNASSAETRRATAPTPEAQREKETRPAPRRLA